MSSIAKNVAKGLDRLKRAVLGFRFQNFSKRQAQLVTWWMPGSPHADADGVIAQGAIRSGKTTAVITGFVLWTVVMFHMKGREADFIVAGKTMGALKRNVLKPMFAILRTFGIPFEYVRSSEAPHVRIGLVTYYLFAGANEASQDVLQGFTAAGALADEVVLMPESFIDQMIGRCSEPGSKLWFTCNPAGPFHWFKKRFVDQAAKKRLVNLHFTLDDNPSLSVAIKERYRRMFVGVFYQRYILGLWVLAEGLVYSMFDRTRHLVDPATLRERYKRYGAAIDYGTTNPFAAGLFGYGGPTIGADDEKAALLSLHYYKPGVGKETVRGERTDAEHAEAFEAWLNASLPPGRTLDKLVVDPSAKSFITELQRRGYTVTKARNDVAEGIRETASMLQSMRLVVADLPEMEPAEQEFSTYAWDPNAQAKGEDKPLKASDHVMDMIRYFVLTVLVKRSAFDPQKWNRLTS